LLRMSRLVSAFSREHSSSHSIVVKGGGTRMWRPCLPLGAVRFVFLAVLAALVVPDALADFGAARTEAVLDGHHHHSHHQGHNGQHHHHHHHHGHHHHGHHQQLGHPADAAADHTAVEHSSEPVISAEHDLGAKDVAQVAQAPAAASDQAILQKLQSLEGKLSEKEKQATSATKTVTASQPPAKGKLEVNAPLPMDFGARFSEAVAQATGCDSAEVKLLGAAPVANSDGHLDEVVFEARGDVISAVRAQAADPASKLANGPLHLFLVAHDSTVSGGAAADANREGEEAAAAAIEGEPEGDAPPDVDATMPYGGLEPFGREDTAKELTESSIHESDVMVDQLERAEVAEEKRAVFRALTRLRGAAITSFDGVARAQTGNLDEYSRKNKWRTSHPVHHLAEDESDVSRWAFPENSDF